MHRLILLFGITLLLAGCQTDLPLAGLKAQYGAPPSRYLPMDGVEVHWRDEGQGSKPPDDTAASSLSAATPSTMPRSNAVEPAGAPAAAGNPGPPSTATSPSGAPAGPTIPSSSVAAPDDAPTILLLHGTASSLHTWEGWVKAMSPSWRVVRLDLPGFGLTGPYPSGDYSPAATVDFLERFADAAGLKRFVIAGSSLGGQAAWRYALRRPDRISGLILIDATGYPQNLSTTSAVALQLAAMPIVSELMRWAPIEGMVGSSLKDVYVDDSLVTPELIARYSDLMRRPGNRVSLGDRARSAQPSTGWEQLPSIKVPTLIMWGAQDTWVPLSMGERFKQDIRDSELIVYPNLGHLPMEEDPVTTARDAMAFLRRRVLGGSSATPAPTSPRSVPLQTPALTVTPAQK
jgi:pimeloyl-ACP methyl ester carboxylesterase